MPCTLSEFIFRVSQISAEEPRYRLGGSATDGTCDCIGLIIGALLRCGVSWGGTHGSNYAARYAVDGLKNVSTAAELSLGDIVFKAHPPGESGYKLPDQYKSGSDLNDYYHVGVVERVDPLMITHVTTPTSKRDTTLGEWHYAAKLKSKYIGGGHIEPIGKVRIAGGDGKNPLNMRRKPSTSSEIAATIPQGTVVDLLRDGKDWSEIRYNDIDGYILSRLTQPAGDRIAVDRDELQRIYDSIGKLLGGASVAD